MNALHAWTQLIGQMAEYMEAVVKNAGADLGIREGGFVCGKWRKRLLLATKCGNVSTLQYCVSAQETFSWLFGLGLGFPSVRYIHEFSASF